MKKFKGLNKLLLAGAALLGVVAPGARAAVDIQVTGAGNLLDKFNSLYANGGIEAEINNMVTRIVQRCTNGNDPTINICRLPLSANAGEQKNRYLVEYATLTALDELTKTPVILYGLRHSRRVLGRPFEVRYLPTNEPKDPPRAMAVTTSEKLLIFVANLLKGARDGSTIDPKTGWPQGTPGIYFLSQLNLSGLPNLTAHALDADGRALVWGVACMAHELGHFVAKTFAGVDWETRHGQFSVSRTVQEAWQGKFFDDLYSKFAPAPRAPAQFRSATNITTYTNYSRKSVGEAFAESFAEAALRCSFMGHGLRPTRFEQLLTEKTNCQGPAQELCLTPIAGLA